MKKYYLNPFQANVIQVALTHTYEECAFLTESKIDKIKLLIKKLDVDWPKDIDFYQYEINIVCFALGKNLEMQEDLIGSEYMSYEKEELQFSKDIVKNINEILRNIIGG
tara:strand:- start:224 stop:550 length:327 start_codon:yes stop_codon:yes gene_type:complete